MANSFQKKSDINSRIEIIKRLLQGFSVKYLREIFNIDGSIRAQNDIIYNILKGNDEATILKIIFKNYDLLKQYIYFFDIQGKIPDNLLEKHPFLHKIEKKSKNNKVFEFLFKEDYGILNVDTGKVQNISFLRPVVVEMKGLQAIVSVNILERDLSSIIKAKAIYVNRKSNENHIIESISTFDKTVFFIKRDLNKGIKYLWENDYIDAYKVKFKKTKSTSSEVMDETHLVKAQIPELYTEIMKSPLDSTVFKYLKNDDFVKHFTANPREGFISFNTFPTSKEGIKSIVKLIIQNN